MLFEHFRTMAGYNAWVNEAVYTAAADLADAEYRQPRPAAYFGSLHGTLNHLLVVDRLWFSRIDGRDPGRLSLDLILHEELDALRAARRDEDERIVALVEDLGPAGMAEERSFKDTKGNGWTMGVATMLATVFNHETHHRGQAHALLKDAGREPPSLDLPVYLRAKR